ncbi:MAG: hypothetical protein WED13_01125 [Methyloceanibacter sp.]
MREKRVWPQDKDSDGETVAAFEAAVAVVKETVVRSGEVLVSAKEDLSDHQRWLKVQTAAVEADRARHDRWLHRQRERQEALERREQRRTRRRAMRQAAVRSIRNAVSAASLAVRSALWLLTAKTIAGLNYIDALAASGLAWVGARLRDLVLHMARAVWGGLLVAGRMARSLALSIWILLSAGFSRIAAKVHALAPPVGNFLSLCFGGLAARAHDVSRSVGRGCAASFSWLSARADVLTRSAGEALAPAFSVISAKVYALAPSLSERIGHYARGGAARAERLWAKAPRVDAENAVSLPQRVGRIDLSQMLIIAGALLLVCGGLMLGGGLILRASTPFQIAAASGSEPIAWLFQHKGLPIEERSVFAVAVTPEGVRIKGFSIGGVNMSDDQSLGSVGGVIKPDLQGHDLKLAVSVERSGDDAVGAQADELIPPQVPFKLVFPFPAAAPNGGMTPHDVLAAYGGLMLKVHYEVAGKQKTFIQYLPQSLLEEQLAEILAEAKGS